MGCFNRKIVVTVNDYNISLSREIKFFQNDTIELCFSIFEYETQQTEGNTYTHGLAQVMPLKAYMLLESPEGNDYVEATSIENNEVVFKLTSKHSNFVGIGRMQIVLKDSNGCRVTLPSFNFEIRENINPYWSDIDEPIIPEEPDNPEVTLTSISATYNGGNVTVGTSVNSLTGITVKATYSDGSTKTVTGYTLSGTITEGSNTITVSYGGKTTTFTVTGVAESGGDSSDELITDGLLDYFDFRTCVYNNEGAGGSTLIKPTIGNGQLYNWAKNSVTEQNANHGITANRKFMYSTEKNTTESDLGTEFTIIALTKDTGVMSGTNGENGVIRTNILPLWKFDARYNTATGTGRTGDLGSGNGDSIDDYNFLVKRVNGNLMKVVFDTSSIEIDGGNYNGFTSWESKIYAGTVNNKGKMVALAVYNRALSDVEIEEMRAFMKTLEVA